MCFSAEASFLVGGSLLIAGAATLRKVRYKKDLPIAIIPFLFAIQQIIEGFLWVSLTNDWVQLQFLFSNIYGIFVGIIWPVYAPFAVYAAEVSVLRKKIIASIGIIGIGLAFYTIIGLSSQPVIAEVVNHSIYYAHDVAAYRFVIVMYLLATCIPFIFSSYRHLSLAGIMITLGFFAAFMIYRETFASVWCFYGSSGKSIL